jgi:hypothetical protein
MRRWLLVFLLILLPFQLSWAASAAYCQHERDTQPEHWGHHEDEPRGIDRNHTGDGAKKNTTTQPGGAVAHCIVGHFGCAQHVDVAAGDTAGVPQLPQVLQAISEERFVSHISDVPVRPARSLAL